MRRAVLTAHVVTSVGWLGAVLAFVALAAAAVRSDDDSTVRSLYIAMEVMAIAVLVPLSLASFASGVIQALGTTWGLFRHYWVIAKLSISVVATSVLLLYLPTLRLLADVAASPALADDRSLLPSSSPLLHSTAAVVVLVVAAALSIYKPKGITRRGWRYQQRRRATSERPVTRASAG